MSEDVPDFNNNLTKKERQRYHFQMLEITSSLWPPTPHSPTCHTLPVPELVTVKPQPIDEKFNLSVVVCADCLINERLEIEEILDSKKEIIRKVIKKESVQKAKQIIGDNSDLITELL